MSDQPDMQHSPHNGSFLKRTEDGATVLSSYIQDGEEVVGPRDSDTDSTAAAREDEDRESADQHRSEPSPQEHAEVEGPPPASGQPAGEQTATGDELHAEGRHASEDATS